MIWKRIGAYFIDFTFIVLFTSLVTGIDILNPYQDEYVEAFESFEDMSKELSLENSIDIIKDEKYIGAYRNVIKYGAYGTGISLVCYLLYYVGFQKWNKGQTIGKKLFRIKVVDNNGNNPSVWKYFLRTVIVYNILLSLLILVFAYFLNNKLFIIGTGLVGFLNYFVTIGTFILIIVRNDNKGLHDLVAGTKVVEV